MTLTEFCDKATDTLAMKGHLPKGPTPFEYEELCTIDYVLSKGGKYTTICKGVADRCRKCGKVVIEDGIGWIIQQES